MLDLSAINLQFLLDEEDDADRNVWWLRRPPVGIAAGVGNFAVKKCRRQWWLVLKLIIMFGMS
jgi:hypothetical protein